MRAVGGQTALKTEGDVSKFWNQGQNSSWHLHGQELTHIVENLNANLNANLKASESFPQEKEFCQGIIPSNKPAMMI